MFPLRPSLVPDPPDVGRARSFLAGRSATKGDVTLPLLLQT